MQIKPSWLGRLAVALGAAIGLAACWQAPVLRMDTSTGTVGFGAVRMAVALPAASRRTAALLDVVDHLNAAVSSPQLAQALTTQVNHAGLSNGSGQATFLHVPAGPATLSVSVRDVGDNEIATGSSAVTVEAGRVVSADLSLSVPTRGGIAATITLTLIPPSPTPTPTEPPDVFACDQPYSGTGTESDPLTGSNPASVDAGGHAGVWALYPTGDLTLPLAGGGPLLAVCSTDAEQTLGVTVAWDASAGGTQYRVQHVATGERSPAWSHVQTSRRWHDAGAPSRRVQATAVYAVGTQSNFQVMDLNSGSYSTVGTHAAYVYNAPAGQRGSFVIWVDDRDSGIFTGNSTLQSMADEFRTHIYPTDTCAFGVDPTTAENDAQPTSKQVALADDYVHFVFTRAVSNGTLGFFTFGDLLFANANPDSNFGKILYISSSAPSRALGDLYAVLAHEFQHMLFAIHRSEAVGRANALYEFQSGRISWLNEGMSMLAMLLNGYGPEGNPASPAIAQQIGQFLAEPQNYSMTDFFADQGNPHDAYGMVTLFCEYLYDRLGAGVLKELHTTDNHATMYGGKTPSYLNALPLDLADHVLATHETAMARLFPDFAGAVALDGGNDWPLLPASERLRYRIGRVNLRASEAGTAFQGPAIFQDGATLVLRPFSIGYVVPLQDDVTLKLTQVSPAGLQARLVMRP